MSFADNLKSRIAGLDERIADLASIISEKGIGLAKLTGERNGLASALEDFQEEHGEDAGTSTRLNIKQAILDNLAIRPMTADELAQTIGRFLNAIRRALEALVKEDKVVLGKEGLWLLTLAAVPLSLPPRGVDR